MKLFTKFTFLDKPYFLLSLIILLGLFLRCFNLSQPYWGDEILSLQIVKHYHANLAGMIQYLRMVEVHPPLYYFLLFAWTHLFGFTEAAVRSLSLIFGLAMLPLSYVLGKELWHNTRAALLSALIVAVLPIQIIFSQEARPYIIFSFFGLLCFYWIWLYCHQGDVRRLIYFSLAALIGLYLHYSFVFILAPLFLWWIIMIIKQKNFSEFRRVLAVISILFLAFYWWLSDLFYKIVLGEYELFGLLRSSNDLRLSSIFESSLNQLIWTTKLLQILPIEIFATILAKCLIFFSILKLASYKDDKKKMTAFFSLLFLAAISFSLFLFFPQSQNYISIYEKHIIWLSVLLSLLIAGVASNLQIKQSAVLISFVLISFIPFNAKILMSRYTFDKDRAHKNIAEQINESYRIGDIVIDNFSYDRSNLNYYLNSHISAYGFYPPQLLDWRLDSYVSRETIGFLENEAQSRIFPFSAAEREQKLKYIIDQSGAKRIWLAYADYQDYGLKSWLDNNGWRHALYSIDRFSPLDLYVKK
jgi:uncharacterized membrane protein